jgi:hypothetical protein
MILSKKHNFIFIKGMKVAGTSIEMALSALCGPDDIVTPVSQVDELERIRLGGRCQNYAEDREAERKYLEALAAAPPERLGQVPQPVKRYFNHMPLAAVGLIYGGDISGFEIVCAERSPYSKVLSWANMQLSYTAYRGGGIMRADPAALQMAVDGGLASGEIRNTRNIDRYRGADGKVTVRQLHYDRLAEDFAAFVRGLGETVPPLPHAKKGLMSDTLDPRQVLRPDQIARINQIFAEEFECFGYPMV